MSSESLIKNSYNNFLEDYSNLIVENLISNSDISFEELDEEEQNDEYDLLGNFDWKSFTDEHCKFTISPGDLTDLKLFITASKYFEYAFDNRHSRSKYKNFVTDLFKRDCLISAILKYTVEFSERFKTPKFLNDTEEYINNFSLICDDFFKGL